MLNHEIDKGDILCRSRVPIGPDECAGTLHDKLMVAGTDLVVETVEKIAAGDIVPVGQDGIAPAEIREAPKIFKDTCRINWKSDRRTVFNLIRGLSPYPVTWSELRRDDAAPLAVKIYRAHPDPDAGAGCAPGTILSDGKTFLKVACADGYVFLDELQVAGKKRMPVADLLRGFQRIDACVFV